MLFRSQTLIETPSVSRNEAQLADLVEQALRAYSHLDVVRDGNSVVARTNLGRSMIADKSRIDALALAIQDWNASRSRLNTPALIGLRPLAVSLPQLKIPVNAIWGERDQIAYYTLESRIAALRELRPGIEPHVIPGAGHWAAYEAADAFNAVLAGFLK